MPSGLFMGSISTFIYTSELIFCFTICVHSATWHNIHICQIFRTVLRFTTSLDQMTMSAILRYVEFCSCNLHSQNKLCGILPFFFKVVAVCDTSLVAVKHSNIIVNAEKSQVLHAQ